MFFIRIVRWALEQRRQVQREARQGKKMPSGPNPWQKRCKWEKEKLCYKEWQPDRSLRSRKSCWKILNPNEKKQHLAINEH